LCLTGVTAVVIIRNTMGTNLLKCKWCLTGEPEENGEDMVDTLERGLSNPTVTLHPFLAYFLHWHTRCTHRLTTLCRGCGHTAHDQYTEMTPVLNGTSFGVH
jgi:hypothetical protein